MTTNFSAHQQHALAALTDYIAEHGHSKMPFRHETADGLRLGLWVKNARARHRSNGLAAGVVEALTELPGWTWENTATTNSRRVAQVRNLVRLHAFVAEHGHANVPQHYKTADGDALGLRVKSYRKSYTRSALSQSLISELEALPGWLWKGSKANRTRTADGRVEVGVADQFADRVRALRLYAHTHGHTRVPMKETTAAGINLGSWVTQQRTRYRKGSLSHRNIAALEAVPHWSWTPDFTVSGPRASRTTREATATERQQLRKRLDRGIGDRMERNLALLAVFAEEHGHTRVPRDYVTTGGVRLGLTVKNLQDRRATLHPEMVRRLEQLPGWTWWKVAAQATDAALSALDAFIAEHGTSKVPVGAVVNGVALGDVVRLWRKQHRAGLLPVAVAAELTSKPDWKWTLRRTDVTQAA
ncbi:helicase associated domain-containing protein [Curtobacterium citreum]